MSTVHQEGGSTERSREPDRGSQPPRTREEGASTSKSPSPPGRPDESTGEVVEGSHASGKQRDVSIDYDDLFPPPALAALSKEEVYRRVRRLAEAEPGVARRAVEEAEREFFRKRPPFDYGISETAEEVGGQNG